MPALIIRTVLVVNEGQLDAFLDVVERWVDTTRNEPGTVAYHAFVDREGGQAIFLEHYADDAAFLVHRDAIAPELRTELYQTCAFGGFELYGDPGDEVAGLLSSAHRFGHYRSK
jgi:quinol monooxygenase YgiN